MADDAYEIWRGANPLRVWRVGRGLSMMAVASALDVSHITIQNWETGSSEPSGKNMDALASMVGAGVRGKWGEWSESRPTVKDMRRA